VGRINTRERERSLIQLALFVQVPLMIGLAFVGSLVAVFVLVAIGGAAESAGNVGIFALRQRRTAPAWFGRAFAISMSLNLSGAPLGAAISGPLVARSVTEAMLVGAGISLLAIIATYALIPRHETVATGG
jgi:predicted MFS family arabinose efflux permease